MSWRKGGIFVAGNLTAGLLNYLFQVVAARELAPPDFAGLNAWLAHIAVFSVTAGLLQYAANFFPSRQSLLRATIVAFNALALLALWIWISQTGLSHERAALVVLVTSLFGWLLGQTQIRLAFVVMAAGALVLGAAKLGLAFAPFYPAGNIERFALGLFGGYLPGLWALSLYLWKSHDPATPKERSWAAPVVLSVTAAMLPQFDMVLMNHSQDSGTFESFVKASLFYKSIYFWVYIGAQWLLPHQILGKAAATFRGLLLTFAAAMLGCAVLTVISPIVSTWLLRWSAPPDIHLVFWSCVHMSLLTMLFLWIQEMCAHRRPHLAAAVLAVLGLEGLLQILLRLEAGTYLTVVTVLQLLLLLGAYWLSGHLPLRPRATRADLTTQN